ncbi:MAG: transcription antitermination factor NusB [Synergistaceae bacterium]|jgi:N utilization substance protein B|nr:transcription antitermination factor NusB [Synergistaceae bacterium]
MAKPRLVRPRAREMAVQLLYALASRGGQDAEAAISLFLASDDEDSSQQPDAEAREYMSFLVTGVWARRDEIDEMLKPVVIRWRPERIVAVDRAVLRLAVFEGFMEKKVPPAVAISEAVRLASMFGTDDSPRFVNGVLGGVLRNIQSNAPAEHAPSDIPA